MVEPVTLEQQIIAVRREIAMRKGVYPKWVAAGRLKPEKADHEIAAMEAVLASLERMRAINLDPAASQRAPDLNAAPKPL